MTKQAQEIRAGFVGLGDMGGAQAQRMIDVGIPVTLWARREAALEPYKDSGAKFASSLKELGKNSDFVGVCVFADKDVESVIDGNGEGIVHGMAPGGVIAIHSTVSIECCQRMEALATSKGIGLLDAPVSGARRGAQAGTLCIMCGGEQDAFDKARPVFESYGKTIELAGPIGSGQVIKTLVNVTQFSHVTTATIAAYTAEKLGLDGEVAKRVLVNSGSRSFTMELLYSVVMKDPVFAAHSITMQEKDTGLFKEICQARGVDFPVLVELAEESIRLVSAMAKKS